MYPRDETTVLKLLTYLMIRKYDDLFSPVLFSFRPGKTAKDAVRLLFKKRKTEAMYCYKADISNYFGSIKTGFILPMLKKAIYDDEKLYDFLKSLLTEPYTLDRNELTKENRGIMAGTPQSAFLANLFLRELDEFFFKNNIPYARYSDDIIVFADTEDKLHEYADHIRLFLADLGLDINPNKEFFSAPHEGRSFLGFSYNSGVIDIAPETLRKLKRKMHRKTRALHRWSSINNIDGKKAARAFIRVFNSKLFDISEDNELSWSHWFFSVITTDKSLRIIDSYAQDCLRYLVSGTRTKARYNTRYEELKELGYRSLVHEYYTQKD